MRNYPRNEKCPCGSGLKFKKCHLPKIPLAITKDYAKYCSAWLDRAKASNFTLIWKEPGADVKSSSSDPR